MGIEIERKWMASCLPDWVKTYPHRELVQGYLCTDPVIRVRKEGDEHYLTYKGRGILKREEYNLPLTAAAFEKLIAKADGIILEKTRYYVPVDRKGEPAGSGSGAGAGADRQEGSGPFVLTAEIDVFHGVYQGRVYVEVEFRSVEEASVFTAPDWFGTEVTGASGYSNAELAYAGRNRQRP